MPTAQNVAPPSQEPVPLNVFTTRPDGETLAQCCLMLRLWLVSPFGDDPTRGDLRASGWAGRVRNERQTLGLTLTEANTILAALDDPAKRPEAMNLLQGAHEAARRAEQAPTLVDGPGEALNRDYRDVQATLTRLGELRRELEEARPNARPVHDLVTIACGLGNRYAPYLDLSALAPGAAEAPVAALKTLSNLIECVEGTRAKLAAKMTIAALTTWRPKLPLPTVQASGGLAYPGVSAGTLTPENTHNPCAPTPETFEALDADARERAKRLPEALARGSEEAAPGVAVDNIEASILRLLSDPDCLLLMSVRDIAENNDGAHSSSACGDALKRLEQRTPEPYVHRPNGPAKGYGVTSAGKQIGERLRALADKLSTK